jgi:hypothetical protein
MHENGDEGFASTYIIEKTSLKFCEFVAHILHLETPTVKNVHEENKSVRVVSYAQRGW